MTSLDNLPRPWIFGHRGACANAPENTLASFRLAVEQGADGIELDTKLSLDGIPMVIHDPTVDRTTDGHGVVRQMTLEALKKLDAGSSFSTDFKGEPIPTLEEVYQNLGKKTIINVELTNYTSPGDDLTDRVAKLVEQYQLQEWVIFSSFHPLTLIRIRRHFPKMPAGLLCEEGKKGSWGRSWIGRWLAPEYIHPYQTDTTAEFIQQEHQRGRKVNVWTVDDPKEIQRLNEQKVDGIITDNPLLARQVIGRI
jgi:glycerophosphoryl diester phosphodiesterase